MFRAAALLLATCVFAQDTIVVESNLVLLDVSVRNRRGNSVGNLPVESFSVYEDGSPQHLSVFEAHFLNAEVSKLGGSEPKVGPAGSKSALRRTQSDRQLLGQNEPEPRAFGLLFDWSSMSPADRKRATAAADAFVTRTMAENDLALIAEIDLGLRIVADLTSDRAGLLLALHGLNWGTLAQDASVDREVNGLSDRRADAGTAGWDIELEQTESKLSAIASMCRLLKRADGRRALIYFSSGLSKSAFDSVDLFHLVTGAATDGEISIYPVDVRGLLALPPGGDATRLSPSGIAVLTGMAQLADRIAYSESKETLYGLADATGGLFLTDTNDIAGVLSRIAMDVASFYILGYYQDTETREGLPVGQLKVRLEKGVKGRVYFRKVHGRDAGLNLGEGPGDSPTI